MEKGSFVPVTTISGVFFRFLGGIWAGALGSIVMGVILFFTWTIVGDILMDSQRVEVLDNGFSVSEATPIHPLFIPIVLISIFLSGLVANLVFCVINTTMGERYPYRSTTLTHVFFGNLLILFLFIPIYLILGSIYGATGIGVSSITHVIIMGLFTFFVSEILSTSNYAFVSLYGAVLGLGLFVFWSSFLADKSPIMLTLLAFPLLLGFLNGSNAAVEMFYFWISEIYGVKFLETNKRFGSDYGRTEIVSEEMEDDL